MNSADETRLTLVYADGYSYTEIIQVTDPGMPSGNQLICIFHALFGDDRDDILISAPAPGSPSDTVNIPDEVI